MASRVFLRAFSAILFGVVGSWIACGSVVAQQTMNPPGFDPYAAAYRGYAFPGAGDNPAITNSQMSARPLTTINNFGRLAGMDDGLGGDDGMNPFPNGGRYQRYDSSYRMYDRSLGREFNANGKSDSTYFSDRQKREELQLKLMRETDPKKIEALKKQIEKIGDRPDRLPDDATDPYLSMRRTGGGTGSSSGGMSSRRASGTASAPVAASGSVKPAVSGRASDSKKGSDYAPSPSSVLERSRRMNTTSSTTPATPPSAAAPR